MKKIHLVGSPEHPESGAVDKDFPAVQDMSNMEISENLAQMGHELISIIRPGAALAFYLSDDGEKGGVLGFELEEGDLE